MTHATIALVIAQPGPFRKSLMTLLSTMPEIEIIAEARDLETLQRAGEELQPDLILIETDVSSDELQKALHQFKQKCACTQMVVLVDTIKHQAEAKAAGADIVLLKGFRAPQLIEQIQAVLAHKVASPCQNKCAI